MSSDVDPKAEKARRIHMINRRSTAWLLEIALIEITLVPIFAAFFVWMTGDVDISFAAIQLLVWVPYILIRDILGVRSWGKKVVGLTLASDADARLSTGQKVIRNIPLIVPFVPLIEFFVAFKGSDPKMRRLGDRWAKTHVVAEDAASVKGSYSLQLVLALFVMYGAYFGAQKLAPEYYFLLASGPQQAQKVAKNTTTITTRTSPTGYRIDLPDELKPEVLKNDANSLRMKRYITQQGVIVLKVSKVPPQELSGYTVDSYVKQLLSGFKPPQFTGVRSKRHVVGGRLTVDVWAQMNANGKKLSSMMRHIIAGDRIYQLVIVRPQTVQEPAWQKRAWSSFALTDKAPAETVEEAIKRAKGKK